MPHWRLTLPHLPHHALRKKHCLLASPIHPPSAIPSPSQSQQSMVPRAEPRPRGSLVVSVFPARALAVAAAPPRSSWPVAFLRRHQPAWMMPSALTLSIPQPVSPPTQPYPRASVQPPPPPPPAAGLIEQSASCYELTNANFFPARMMGL